MTDRLNSDIGALFRDPALGLDPAASDRRARLAVDLAAALAAAPAPSAATADDPARVAAYLDHGLTDDEKEVYFGDLASSPAALAEVDAMLTLLDAVEGVPLRAPDAVVERARALLAVSPAAPTLPWWRFSRIARPQARFGLGLASAFLALFVAAPIAWLEIQSGESPVIKNSQWLLPGALPGNPDNQFQIINRDGPAARPGNGWAAIAVSPSTHVFGTAASEATLGDASRSALARCAEQGARDCEVRLSGDAECLALASGRNGGVAVAADRQLQSAEDKALEACLRGGAEQCVLRAAACGG